MRVFVTGATGFIGSAVVSELLANGHQVLGLTRSEQGAAALAAAGAETIHGSLEDLDSLRRGAAAVDGVIHTAFIHDFSKFEENCEIDRRAIEALGEALAGSNRALIVSAGLPVPTEDEVPPPGPFPRVSEQAAVALVERGVRAMVMRLPQVHDRDKQGLVSYLIALAREKGISVYVGAGLNRWPAVHRLDVAPLYRLALEKGSAGARYHAVAEEGVSLREIAEAIGRGLKIPVVAKSPEEAAAHFGWMGFFAGMDLTASSTLTQQRLGWHLTDRPGMIADLDHASAFGA
jgi:nucleoside-diphosphate-sugar epimerase